MKLPEPIRRWAIGAIGKPLFWTWFKLCRWRIEGEEDYRKLRAERKPVILIMWHGRIFTVPYFFRKRNIMPLVSPSRDGEIPAQIMERWGYNLLRGSSSHSVVKAWNTMVRELRAGGEVIIVPDGPRGPNRVLKEGCLKLAQATGAFVVPWTFSSSRKKFIKSWDKFLMFWPLCRVVALYGKPFTVDPKLKGDALESLRQKVEVELTAFDALADQVISAR